MPSTASEARTSASGIASGGASAANGVSTTAAIARLVPIAARESRCENLRLSTIGAAA